MAVLHRVRATAVEAALLHVARTLGPFGSLDEAADARAFTVDDALDVWQAGWRDDPPPAQMGPMAQRLRALTYAIFVQVPLEDVGFMLEHPEALPPKSVTASFTTKEPCAPRAFLAVADRRVLLPFPLIESVLLDPAADARFRDTRLAFERLVDAMVEQVNIVTPAALALRLRS